MENKELEHEYLLNATAYVVAELNTIVPEDCQAIFMLGVQYGLDLRDQELNNG